ncbi:MAG: rRNA maturation RNase YbeY [Dehalococcoidia bacterium]|jgi:probable rRNA maturation factor|nr:rRNA maturation RNase YbeY [Dehalococcoidia bacterium]
MTNRIELDIDDAYAAQVPSTELLALLDDVLAAESVDAAAQLTIRITGDELLQELNRTHRGIDAPTDVLSFPAEDDDFPSGENHESDSYLGDIAISVPAVHRNAELTGTLPDRELRHLVTHGVLHLLGYDHDSDEDEARMRAREVELLGGWVNAIWDAPPTH